MNHLHGVLDQCDQSLMPRIVARMRGEDRVLLSFNLSFVCFGQPEGGIRSPELEQEMVRSSLMWVLRA